MESQLKSKIKKNISILVLGFLILFAFRLLYGYSLKTDHNTGHIRSTQFSEDVSRMTSNNIATKKYKGQSSANSPTSIKVDQKY